MKASKNYPLKIMLIATLVVSFLSIIVACDKRDGKNPFKYVKPFGIELTVATVSSRNAGRYNYSEIRRSNLLTEDGIAKLDEVQEKTNSDTYGIYLGYDEFNNVVLYIGGLVRGAQYEKYDCALPYSPRDIITKMEEAVGHTLSEDWLNASETGIDIIFISKGGKYEVAYTAEVDGQVYVITM